MARYAHYGAPEFVQVTNGWDRWETLEKTRADIFSIGCILHWLICGIGPHRHASVDDILKWAKWEKTPKIVRLNDVSNNCVDFVKHCLEPHEEKRWSNYKELSVHLFLKGDEAEHLKAEEIKELKDDHEADRLWLQEVC